MWQRLVLLGLVLSGCATAEIPALSREASEVRIGKADPGQDAQEIGPIEVTHGSGCGGFGEKGSYEGAVNMLKAKAAQAGANFVQVFTMTEPHQEPQCMDNKYVIRGTAFRVPAKAPSAAVAAPPPGAQ